MVDYKIIARETVKYFYVKDLLNCRLVGRTWGDAACLELAERQRSRDKDSVDTCRIRREIAVISLTTERSLSLFITHFPQSFIRTGFFHFCDFKLEPSATPLILLDAFAKLHGSSLRYLNLLIPYRPGKEWNGSAENMLLRQCHCLERLSFSRGNSNQQFGQKTNEAISNLSRLNEIEIHLPAEEIHYFLESIISKSTNLS